MRTIAVLGAGSWGTALAVHLGRLGHDVRLWARDVQVAADISTRRANAIYLPDVSLPEAVIVTASIPEALSDCDLVVSAIPSHGCRAVMREAAPCLQPHATVISAFVPGQEETAEAGECWIAEKIGDGVIGCQTRSVRDLGA